ncbi:hypothetical protein U1Q18_027160, partial [Sarracenia purpurea var. burkii]
VEGVTLVGVARDGGGEEKYDLLVLVNIKTMEDAIRGGMVVVVRRKLSRNEEEDGGGSEGLVEDLELGFDF